MNVTSATHERGSGHSFGRYRLVASVGHGGMADVYLAVAAGPAGVNKLQVLKRLRSNLSEEPEFLAMFLDEARLAARLNHPNVVQTNEVGQVDNDYFIAMEYLDGQPLNRILRAANSSPLPPGFGLHVVAEALSGLHYAHELTDYDGTPLSIVHRDTSPHNIFVTYEGQTKLVDFGIAKAMNRSTQTNGGMIKGKFAYMAPEQARCAVIDRRADVFVMGIVLWEVIAGRRMWHGVVEMEVLRRLVVGDLPRLAEVVPDAPLELVCICYRALSNDPNQRYATAAEMRRDLLTYLSNARLTIAAEQVSAYLTAVFAVRRAEMQRTIEQQLGRLTRSADLGATDTLPPASSSLPELGGASTTRELDLTPSRSHQTQLAALTSSKVVAAPPPPRRGRLAVLLGGALLGGGALVATGGAYAGFGRHAAESAAHPEASAAATPQAPVATTIELQVRADPASARIFLDDAALPANPFLGRFAADGLSHRLHVEATGYAPRTQIIAFEKDAAFDVTLAPTAAVAPTTAPAPAAAGRRGVRAPVVVAIVATSAPAAAPVAPPGLPAAPVHEKRALDDPWGDGAKPSAAPKRALDNADPFH